MRYDEGDCLDANKDDEEGKTARWIQSTLSPTKIFQSISISWLALMICPSYAPGGRPSAGSVIHVHRITHIRPSTEYQRFRALALIRDGHRNRIRRTYGHHIDGSRPRTVSGTWPQKPSTADGINTTVWTRTKYGRIRVTYGDTGGLVSLVVAGTAYCRDSKFV